MADLKPLCGYYSIGLSLTDTLDDLINEGRIEPQLAMKILSTFDRVITEVLAEKVQVKLSFKVHCPAGKKREEGIRRKRRIGERREEGGGYCLCLTVTDWICRATWIPTDSATKCGRSLSRTLTSSWTIKAMSSLTR